MKDSIQNIADTIGALAEDIEEIKKMLVARMLRKRTNTKYWKGWKQN